MKWKSEGGIVPGGDVGGDRQVTESWSVRYRSVEDPTRVVTVYFYGEATSDTPADGSPYDITRQVEYMICQDPKQAPGDTEVWSNADYEVASKSVTREWKPEAIEGLQHLARILAGQHTADMIDWDGEPY